MKRLLKKHQFIIAAAALLTLAAVAGVFGRSDRWISDAVYQQRTSPLEDIVIIGIDQRALDALGPYGSWGRGAMADVVEALNADKNSLPSVIGLDIVFSGASDPEGDLRLAEAAGRYGNVIAGSLAEYGTAVTEDDTLDRFAVTAYDEPYESLAGAVETGHVNCMLDGDGILRHQLLYVDLPDGRRIPSLALAVADRFTEVCGLDPIERPPVDARGFWYLPFTGRPGDRYEGISVIDLLDGKVPASRLKDKIVLVGPYAAGLQDAYLTAIDHSSQMYGVEVQANAVQALLGGKYAAEIPDGIQAVVLFLLLLAGGVLFWKRPIKRSLPAFLILCAAWTALCYALYALFGWVLHVLWFPAGALALYIAGLAANYAMALLETKRITGIFKKYLAPEIVAEIIRRGDGELLLEAHLSQIAVLFVDVRGFTPLSEKLDPGQVVEILNRYLSMISDCILSNGGTLDKFIGDAAMAFWGAPLPCEDHVMKAVRAADAMRKGARPLSDELREKYGCDVAFGIGIHCGEAMVGSIGSQMRMDYTAIGDTVNTASRLEANAPGGTVYLSREVYDSLKGRIMASPLPEPLKLKGKEAPQEVYVLEGILTDD